MKKVILILGVLLLLLAAAVVGVLLYANRYVQSPAFKERLVAEISKVTGGTVQIDTINVSLTSRVEVGGIRLDRTDPKTGSQAFSTKNILVKFNFWELLHRKIGIEELSLESPDIKIVSAPKPPPPAGPGETIAPETAAQAPSPKPAGPAGTTQTPSVARPAIELVIRKAEVRNGKLDIILPNGRRIILENFSLQSVFESTHEPIRFRGLATCAKITLDDQPPVTGVDAAFHFDNDTLFIEKAKGSVFRGTIEADGRAKIDGDQPFSFHVKCSNADLKALLEKKPELAQAIEGAANADLTLEGTFASPLDATGRGAAQIGGGKVNVTRLKNEIARVPLGVLVQCVLWATQMPELETLAFSKCETDFSIAGRKVNFSRIDAEADHVKLKGTGFYGFDQTIDFQLRSSISEQVYGKIPPVVSSLFVKDPDNFYGFDFRVFGTVDHPENDVVERIGPEQFKAIGSALESLVPQGVINNTFDTLEGLIKKKENKDTNAPASEKKPGLLESIFDSGSSTNSAPAKGESSPPDGSTNSAPKKGVLDKIQNLF